MENVLTRKLASLSPFDREDRELLASVVNGERTVKAHKDIIREGESPDSVHLITSGFACRHKILPDGTRQIFAYLLPGDFCDLHIFILDVMDHAISTLSPCTVVDIPRSMILRLTERPAIARALWWATLVDESTLREAVVNMGRRRAEERVAHFLCELLARLEVVGLVADNTFSLPITQAELGDTMGLSTVHINRVLQDFRRQKLITFGRGSVKILDVAALKRFSSFNPNYLHLGRHKPKLDRSPQSSSSEV